jgi:hypothetical protein
MLLVVGCIFLKMWSLTRVCIHSANLIPMMAHVFGPKFYFFHPNTNLYLSMVMGVQFQIFFNACVPINPVATNDICSPKAAAKNLG